MSPKKAGRQSKLSAHLEVVGHPLHQDLDAGANSRHKEQQYQQEQQHHAVLCYCLAFFALSRRSLRIFNWLRFHCGLTPAEPNRARNATCRGETAEALTTGTS